MKKSLYPLILFFFFHVVLNSQMIHETPSSINYNGDSDKNKTNFYEINNVGFYGITFNARHDNFYYPRCPQDFSESNWYEIDAHNVSVSDINLDGFDDVIVYWKPTPHRAIKKYTGSFSVLINNQEGGFELSNNYILNLFENKGNRSFEDVTVNKIDGYYTLEREHLSDLGEIMSIDKDGDGDYDLVPKDVKVFCCLPSQYDFVSDLYWENVGGRYVRRIND